MLSSSYLAIPLNIELVTLMVFRKGGVFTAPPRYQCPRLMEIEAVPSK